MIVDMVLLSCFPFWESRALIGGKTRYNFGSGGHQDRVTWGVRTSPLCVSGSDFSGLF